MTTTTAAETLFINGEHVPAANGGLVDSYDPSTGDVLARLARAGRADVDRAVRAARAALDAETWGGLAPAERGRLLHRIALAIRARAEELSVLESRDTGKPLRQGRTDVQVAARYFEFYAGVADKVLGTTIPLAAGFLA